MMYYLLTLHSQGLKQCLPPPKNVELKANSFKTDIIALLILYLAHIF